MSIPLKSPRVKRDEICNTLRAEVLSGQWESNQPVREHSLAERFGVSRGPIRDALLQLTQEGALVYRQNKGVRVSSPPEKADRDLLFRLRRDLEIHCLKEAFPDWSETDDDQLSNVLTKLKRACEKEDLSEVTASDLALHRYWVSKASKEMEVIWLSISVRLKMAYSRLKSYMEIYNEHEPIVKAIHRRDLKTAQSLIRKNVI
ncbi:MAG: hypothetical protein CMI30_01585 [Opitutae bacterium]|nr:hypothetical protein [Opitutae bacterium]|tara:strand:- start:900 stop:1508 length:609 start_codon:yes stop_codon:yes gene_type:complete